VIITVTSAIRDEEYKRKVEHSLEPVVVTFLSPSDDECRSVALKIEELSDEFPTINFYQVDVGKHPMLCRALSNTRLPIVVFVKNGADFLTLTSDISLPSVREGLQALQRGSC
jgi:thioredoxin 1